MNASVLRPPELWLPALDRFDPAHPPRRLLARSDRLDDGPRGYLAGLAGYFDVGASPLPVAALTRELLAGDAGDAAWLCADPAWVQPDMNGARLLACGRMQLSPDEARELADALRPVFDEAGIRLDVATPDRWHLRLPAGLGTPDFAAPELALGEDLYQHLPAGTEGRRWRVLFNEVQVMLHQHPRNAARIAEGLPPVNCLWLWGAGRLPASVRTGFAGAVGDDLLLGALAARAGVPRQPRTPANVAAACAGWLVDLQDLPVAGIERDWWPALQALARRLPLCLAFASGERWLHRPWHRWRFWRGSRR
jgi:hypothetical protein